MNFIPEKIRRGGILFFSFTCIVYCLITHALYPPSSFLNRGFYVAIAFILFFLTRLPKVKNRWDYMIFSLATVGGVAVCLYMMVEEGRIADNFYRANETDFYILLLYLVSTSIAISHMSGGIIVAGMGILSALYIFYGQHVPGLFGHAPFSLGQSTMMLLTDVDKGALGSLAGTLATLLSIFLVFAAMLLASGLGDLINSVAMRLLGHLRGGPAKIAVVSSALFGMLSGSPVANVGCTGAITIPLMKKIGYKPETAGAIEAIAGTGGELVPPVMGICAFIMAEILGISYTTICLWGIIPSLIWYWCLYWIVHYNAYVDNVSLWAPPKAETWQIMKDKWHVSLGLLAFFVIIIITQIPEVAAFYSVIVMFVVSMARKTTRLNGHRFKAFLENFAETFAGIGLLLSLVGIFVSALTSTGFHIKLGMFLFGGVHHWLIIALIVFAVCVLFGMAIPVVAAYIAVVLIAAPLMVELGFKPGLIHMFVFYACCLAPITPPVAMAVYTASSISGADPMRTGLVATWMSLPLWIMPFSLLGRGYYIGMGMEWQMVLYWTVLALVGAYVFILGSVGHFKAPLSRSLRAIAVVIGLLVLQPLNSALSLAAAIAGVVFVLILYLRHRSHGSPQYSLIPDGGK